MESVVEHATHEGFRTDLIDSSIYQTEQRLSLTCAESDICWQTEELQTYRSYSLLINTPAYSNVVSRRNFGITVDLFKKKLKRF